MTSFLSDQENIISNSSRLPNKQNGIERLKSTKKKNALADVKNILHQRCTAQESPSKNQLLKPLKYENCDLSVKNVFASKINNGESTYADVCHCPDHPETQDDDYTDILFKHIRLSKNQIENLAMEWEKTPLYNQSDKREVNLPEAATFDIDYDLIKMDWQIKDIAEDNYFEVPPPI